MNRLQYILDQMGLRLDAKQTASLEKSLEYVKSSTYDILYPNLKARRLIPVSNEADPGAETISYQQWDSFGMAEIIANYADDISMVEALAEVFTNPVHGLAKGYQYSIQDLRRAAMNGNQLPTRKAAACRLANELAVDNIAAVGNPAGKMKGLVNHPNVTVLTAKTDGTATEWVTRGAGVAPKSALNIKRDMHTLISEIFVATKEVHSANTLLMGTVEFGHISQEPVGTDNQTSILRSFLANNEQVSTVESWHKLDLADAAGTGPRMIAYQRDPMVLQLEIPQEFEQFPAQAKNLAYMVPTHSRIGGTIVYYPLALAYMDGV